MPQGVRYEGIFGEADEGAIPLASKAMRSSAGVTRELRAAESEAHPRLGLSFPEAAFDRAQQLPRSDGPAAPTTLSTRARERLAPELLALVAGDESAKRRYAPDGRVEVKVTLATNDTRALDALRRAGLTIRTRADGWVIGAIDVARLAALAEVTGVRRVLPSAG
jgi:hypothetical protein